jgi:hypothetical protein
MPPKQGKKKATSNSKSVPSITLSKGDIHLFRKSKDVSSLKEPRAADKKKKVKRITPEYIGEPTFTLVKDKNAKDEHTDQ